jgi:HisJ family histidinol phosphate phosphatase
LNDTAENDPRLPAIPDIHGHAKGEHKAFTDERPIPLSARMLFLWFYHACRRGWPRFLMVSDHMNYLTFEDPAAINLVRRALKLAQAGDLYGAAETASVEVGHAAVVSEGLRRGMRYSIGAEVDNDPRSRPDAQNIVDAMKPDGMIRSVHFLTIDHPTHGPNWNWPFDNPEFADVYELVGTAKTWELYMATLLDAVERLPGNIVGHFYVPAIFGHWPDDATLDTYENQIVDACEARGMAIEFNTRFLYRDHTDEEKSKYLAAHRRLLVKCKAKNVGIAVGSDAHSPKDQGARFETVLALLDECEINELTFPIAGRLARVALRVERKVEPAVEAPAPPPDERKAARRARPSEAPTTDDSETPAATIQESEAAPKIKAPRPKRGKSVSAASEPTTVAEAGSIAPEPALVVVSDEAVSTEPLAEIVHGAVAEAIVSDASDSAPDVESAAAGDAQAAQRAPSDVAPDSEPDLTEDEIAAVDEAVVVRAESVAEAGLAPARKSRPKSGSARAEKVSPTTKAKPAPAAARSGPKKSAKPAAKVSVKKASAAKKAAPKKVTAKKAAVKKTAAKKAPSKKAAVRATTTKKPAAKKTAAKKVRPKKPQRRR